MELIPQIKLERGTQCKIGNLWLARLWAIKLRSFLTMVGSLLGLFLSLSSWLWGDGMKAGVTKTLPWPRVCNKSPILPTRVAMWQNQYWPFWRYGRSYGVSSGSCGWEDRGMACSRISMGKCRRYWRSSPIRKHRQLCKNLGSRN